MNNLWDLYALYGDDGDYGTGNGDVGAGSDSGGRDDGGGTPRGERASASTVTPSKLTTDQDEDHDGGGKTTGKITAAPRPR